VCERERETDRQRKRERQTDKERETERERERERKTERERHGNCDDVVSLKSLIKVTLTLVLPLCSDIPLNSLVWGPCLLGKREPAMGLRVRVGFGARYD
jgi:hypothetical protein